MKSMIDSRVCILTIMLIGCISVSSSNKIYAQESVDSAYQKGASYLKQNKLDEAISEFSKAIELNPRSDKAYYDRGRAYGAKGDLERALADYTQVININSPETIQSAYNNRGLIYEDKGDLDKALEDYTKGIEAMPNPMFSGFRYFKQVLHRNRAQVYLSRKEFDKALDDVQSIEKLGGSVDPEFIQKIKNHDSNVEVKVALKGSSEKYPDASSEVDLYNSRGYQSFEKGQYDLAIEDYNRALAVDSNVALVYANRANAYAAKGRLDEAIADYNRALEINPKDEKVYHDLGLTYADKRDYEKALYYFNKTFEINPQVENDGQFHNDRGVAYFFLKDYSKCWQDVNKAIELGYVVNPGFLNALKQASGRDK